ncbi:MAG: DPP IV N-terminal domain-containing protein [Planctomycetota bacterium]|nr:DPP IV N-terminal domain-containing protein [Planctomycetota bacterium]
MTHTAPLPFVSPAPAGRTPLQALCRFPLALALVLLATPLLAQDPTTKANYKQATKFSSSFLSKFVYDSSVTPGWIGETDCFWYRFRTSDGRHYWLVDADALTKVPLFDHDLMAARLSELLETPIDAEAIDLSGIEFDESGNEMKFVAKGWNFTYDRTTASLEKKDKAKARSSSRRGRGSSTRQRRNRTTDENKREKTEKEKAEEAKKRQERLLEQWRGALEKYEKKLEGKEDEEEESQQGSSRSRSQPQRGHRSAFSPDLRWYVFSRQNNLYLVERNGDLQKLADVKSAEEETKAAEAAAKKSEGNAKEGDADRKTEEQTDKKGDGETESTEETDGNKEEGNGDAEADSADAVEEPVEATKEKESLRFPFDEAKALTLSEDGVEDYSYGGNEEDDFGMPATVTWSPDSHAFFVSRSDSRGVAELFLVDSLGEPRPSLQQYKYPMPGEPNVRNREFMMFHADNGELIQLPAKWTDESYVDSRWLPNGELRVLRRDRTLRKLEYGIVDPKTGDFEVLFDEKLTDAGINTQTIRYLDDRDQFIWWSERTGWGHYYLYDLSGKLLNPITRGRFRASRIIDVDEEKGLMWFRGNGREKGESIYHEHLYRVRLDGGDLTLLDAGDANHRSVLSKSRNYVVDNASRVDQPPTSVLRNSDGEVIMELAEADMSQLTEMGWQPPERFVVKAADGTTDLYGNMWKPFDFDPQQKYPLIVHVYPGPQTEGVTHSFSATGSRQELAQLGFIVIQVGHRGGTPTRSKAYGSYGYFNMRDYGLEDKKAAIEQLAARNAFIDIDRIGIYGHSGGGFMTAAALLKPPYNKFFKVGVSTAGNHDNNIYNNYWAERYHGLKEAKAKEGKAKESEGRSSNRRTRRQRNDGDTKNEEQKGEQGDKTETSTKDEKKDSKTEQDDKSDDKTRFEIEVATNAELAENLEGKLLLVHGEIDNNVHPAGTMRLVNALIKANKRFDMLIVPGARHSFGSASNYVKHRTWEYFALHLLGDQQLSADITEKHSSR